MKFRRVFTILVGISVCVSAHAQTSPEATTRGNLSAQCHGVWTDIRTAIKERRLLSDPISPTTSDDLRCLLRAIDDTRFDPDPSFNEVLAAGYTKLAVDEFGADNLDFFARVAAEEGPRIRQRLLGVLLEHAHPVAVQSYFDSYRREKNAGEGATASAGGVVGIFGPIVSEGRCAAAACSEHMAETMAIVRSNLDILAAQLDSARVAAPQSRAPQAEKEMTKRRDAQERLRRQIADIQSGLKAVGAAR